MLDEKDIQIDVYSTASFCPVGIRLTHLPTGFVVIKEGHGRRDRIRLIEEAKEELSLLVESSQRSE